MSENFSPATAQHVGLEPMGARRPSVFTSSLSVSDGDAPEAVYFPYDDDATEYLKAKDKTLAPIIDYIGHINRPMDGDLFEAVMRSIIGQQISTAAQKTICRHMGDGLGEVTPETVTAAGVEGLQSFGTTFKKAEYMHDFALKVLSGEFDLDAVATMPDAEAIAALSSLKGVGTWTAEMILLFSLGRQDIFAFDDLAIHRGIRMVYNHRKVTREMFERYRRRFSPYGSVASLYFWEVSHGVVPGLVDHAPKKKPAKKTHRQPRKPKKENR